MVMVSPVFRFIIAPLNQKEMEAHVKGMQMHTITEFTQMSNPNLPVCLREI